MVDKDTSTVLSEKYIRFIGGGLNKQGKLEFILSSGMTFPDVVQLLQTMMLSTMHNVMEQAKKDKSVTDIEEVRKEVFDMVNISSSNVLLMFAPDLATRKDLTAEAILKAENEILDATDKTTPEDVKAEIARQKQIAISKHPYSKKKKKDK